MKKKFLICVVCALMGALFFAGTNDVRKSVPDYPLTDTISNPKVSGGAAKLCSQQSCMEAILKKVDSYDVSSYIVMYKISKTDFVIERRPSYFQEILKTYKPKEITVFDKNITIAGVGYDVSRLVILQ